MSRRRAGLRAALATGLVLVIAACSAAGAGGRTDLALEVYAAASLGPAMAEVERAYEAASPGVAIVVSTDSSAALAAKIEQGAPADVFLSADTDNPARLVGAGLATGDVVAFAANDLAVIVPVANPAGLETPAGLARPGTKVIAAGDAVPITRYAQRLVANLAREPGYPAGFEAAAAANVVSREDSVAGVLAKVALGEGDAGIVYATDAGASDAVATLAIPAAANVRATYGGVVIAGSPNEPAAAAFLDWLTRDDGQAILRSFGFQAAP